MSARKNIKTPLLTVDCIIRKQDSIVLIERRNPPHGWALPGGFVDVGESVEQAVRREMKEETGVDLKNLELFGVYSDPGRDPRMHTVSVVFTADTEGSPKALDDAKSLNLFTAEQIKLYIADGRLVFDHAQIMEDYFKRQ